MELQLIRQKIHDIRGQKVMLDFDLAALYEVETRTLNQAVKRNHTRFPDDFMFQLTPDEWAPIRSALLNMNSSQNVTSYRQQRGTAYTPYAFTEQGVAMLSSVLRSEKAIQVNIAIMRAFVEFRRYALTYAELTQKIAGMEARICRCTRSAEMAGRRKSGPGRRNNRPANGKSACGGLAKPAAYRV